MAHAFVLHHALVLIVRSVCALETVTVVPLGFATLGSVHAFTAGRAACARTLIQKQHVQLTAVSMAHASLAVAFAIICGGARIARNPTVQSSATPREFAEKAASAIVCLVTLAPRAVAPHVPMIAARTACALISNASASPRTRVTIAQLEAASTRPAAR